MQHTGLRASTHRIRVLIVDDHEMVVDGLERCLQEEGDFEVVGKAGTSAAALSALDHVHADVVVLDHRLPDVDGVRTAQLIRERSPETQIVLLTGTDDARVMRAAASAGCAAFITKGSGAGELMAALRAAANGESEFSLSDGSDSLPTGFLTGRERETLELAAAGLENRAIAEQMFLSVNTVRNHFQSILLKLDAHSKLEAVAIGTQLGFIPVQVR